MTAGITNIPMTYPARIFFIHNLDSEKVKETYDMLESFNIAFERTDNIVNNNVFIQTIGNIHPKIIRQIFRNYRMLYPKINSDYRYPFWEIDNKDQVEDILDIYKFLKLPVYVHESMLGYHFISVKPILKEKYAWFVDQARHTNRKYPPISLRIIANKYIGEDYIWNKGGIISEVFHRDTENIKNWINKLPNSYSELPNNEYLIKLQQYYQIVFYSFDHKQEIVIPTI